MEMLRICEERRKRNWRLNYPRWIFGMKWLYWEQCLVNLHMVFEHWLDAVKNDSVWLYSFIFNHFIYWKCKIICFTPSSTNTKLLFNCIRDLMQIMWGIQFGTNECGLICSETVPRCCQNLHLETFSLRIERSTSLRQLFSQLTAVLCSYITAW